MEKNHNTIFGCCWFLCPAVTVCVCVYGGVYTLIRSQRQARQTIIHTDESSDISDIKIVKYFPIHNSWILANKWKKIQLSLELRHASQEKHFSTFKRDTESWTFQV